MNQRQRNAPHFTDFLLLLVLAALFGASFMFTKLAVAEIPPLTVSAVRVFLALLLLYPIMLYTGQHLPKFGVIWISATASAIFGYSLPFALVSWGQLQVQSSLAAIFMAIMPLATLVLAHLFTSEEKLSLWKLSGVLCGLAGVVILFGVDTLKNLGGSDALSQLAILAAAFCYAINAVISRALTNTPRMSMLVMLMLISSSLMVPLSLIMDAPYNLNPSWTAMGSIAVLAIGPTAIATSMILVIIDRQGANFLSQINFMVPLFGIFFGWVFLHERLSASAWLAMLLILLGIGISRQGNRLMSNGAKVTQEIDS